jgi:hypothetical protein
MGSTLATNCRFVGSCHDVEALAILEGLKLVVDNDLKPPVLKSDSAVAVLNLNCATENKSNSKATYKNIVATSALIADCKVVKIGETLIG